MKNRKRVIERSFDMLHILADENRLTILELLSENKEMCARDILEHLDISQPTLSHHMSVLLENHLVEARKNGRWVFYRVSNEAIRELISFFENLAGEETTDIEHVSTDVVRENVIPQRKEVVPAPELPKQEVVPVSEPEEEIEMPSPPKPSLILNEELLEEIFEGKKKKKKKGNKDKINKDKSKKGEKKKKKKGKD